MVDFQLDEMQEMLRELAREFARDEIRPNAEHWDEESIYPKETIQLAHEMGLLNLHIPEAYGGPGLGCMEEVLVNEELAWGDPGFATAAYATALLALQSLLEPLKNKRTSGCVRLQKKALLPPMQSLNQVQVRMSLQFKQRQFVMEMSMSSMGPRCGLRVQDMLISSSS